MVGRFGITMRDRLEIKVYFVYRVYNVYVVKDE